jgi:hypothetical protein
MDRRNKFWSNCVIDLFMASCHWYLFWVLMLLLLLVFYLIQPVLRLDPVVHRCSNCWVRRLSSSCQETDLLVWCVVRGGDGTSRRRRHRFGRAIQVRAVVTRWLAGTAAARNGIRGLHPTAAKIGSASYARRGRSLHCCIGCAWTVRSSARWW